MGFSVLLKSTSETLTAALQSAFEDQWVALHTPQLDWGDKASVDGYCAEMPPSLVVSGEIAFEDPERARLEMANMVAYCAAHDVPLIHLSSHHVFGLISTGEELLEGATAEPEDLLGCFLADLEEQCRVVKRHIILRRGWMLDGCTDNVLATTLTMLLDSGDPAALVSDHHYGRPIRTSFIAGVILALVQQILCDAENWGVFHLRSADKCSEAEFCDALCRILSALQDRPIKMPPIASRCDDRRLFTGNAFLGGRRCTNNFGIQSPPWRKGLKTLVRQQLQCLGFDDFVAPDSTAPGPVSAD